MVLSRSSNCYDERGVLACLHHDLGRRPVHILFESFIIVSCEHLLETDSPYLPTTYWWLYCLYYLRTLLKKPS